MWQWTWALYPVLRSLWRIPHWVYREVMGIGHEEQREAMLKEAAWATATYAQVSLVDRWATRKRN